MTDDPTPAVEALRQTLVADFASAFVRIRGAHNPDPGEPCAWCRLAAEQATEAVLSTVIRDRLTPAQPVTETTDLRAAVIDALHVIGTMGNGEGWTIYADVVLPLWAALPPEDRAKTGYDAAAMAADYERFRESRGYPLLDAATPDTGSHDLACGRSPGHRDPLCTECQREEAELRVKRIVNRSKPKRRRATPGTASDR